jgi:hypothetical protein
MHNGEYRRLDPLGFLAGMGGFYLLKHQKVHVRAERAGLLRLREQGWLLSL